jgi:hypothetical protein
MKYLIYLLFILLSLGQIQRVSFLDQQVNIYLHEVVMTVVVIGQIGQIRRIGIWKEIFFLLVALLLSLINNFWLFKLLENLVGFLYWARLALYFVFFLVLFNWGDKGGRGNEGNKGILRRGLDIFIILTIIFSYVQYFFYPNLRNLSYLGWDPHQYRVFGLFFDTTITGIILVMLFFFGLSRGWEKKEGLSILCYLGVLGLILLTYSRITYFSFVVGIIFYFLITPRRSPCLAGRQAFGHLRGVGILIFVFCLLIFLLPRPFGEGVKLERIFTIEARVIDYQEGLKLWLKKPILGYGYNRLRYVRQLDNITHSGASFSSSFLTILVASGLIGLIGFIRLIGETFKQGNQLIRTIILVITISSLFDNVLLNNFVLLLFLTMVSTSFTPLSGKSL